MNYQETSRKLADLEQENLPASDAEFVRSASQQVERGSSLDYEDEDRLRDLWEKHF